MIIRQASKVVELPSDFDIDQLTTYLEHNLDHWIGPLSIEKFQGGQSNPTYLVRGNDRQFVLRRKPSGDLLPSAHAVDREYRVVTALQNSNVPVPQTYLYCDDATVIGTPFFVMEFIRGRTFWDPSLPGLNPAERGAIYDDVNRVIAALHSVDYGAIGLADYGRSSRYLARQVDRWTRQYRATQSRRIEAMEHLIDWLPACVPDREESSLVHGDFRLDNLLIHPVESRVIAVLDWELSTIGHPLADFAYHMMPWNIPRNVFRGMADIDLRTLGIPDQISYVQRYCQRVGRDLVLPDWDFYLAFNLFRIAAILQGVLHRAEHGNAASNNAREEGMKVQPLAEIGWQFARRAGA